MVAWLTGMPGSGKTTISEAVAEELRAMGHKVEVLDGDWVRRTINPDAGFTRDQRRTHLLRVAWIARLLARNGVIVICSFVSPYRGVREEVRGIVEEEVPFVEVYVRCPLEECLRRDPKGLYRRALAGDLEHFTGVSDPYEPPENPDIVLDTTRETPEQSAGKLLALLSEMGYVGGRDSRGSGPGRTTHSSIYKSPDPQGATGMEEKARVEVRISKDLYEKALEYIKAQGGFDDVDELVEFVLSEVLSEESGEGRMSEEDEEKVKERLRSLGYL